MHLHPLVLVNFLGSIYTNMYILGSTPNKYWII